MKDRLSQAAFSQIALNYITEHHAAFLANIKYQQDGSFDCSLKSKKDIISVWIASYDAEISVGLEDRDFISEWHVPMSSLGAKTPAQEFAAMTKLLGEILSGEAGIEYSEEFGYELAQHPYEQSRERTGEEIVTNYTWMAL